MKFNFFILSPLLIFLIFFGLVTDIHAIETPGNNQTYKISVDAKLMSHYIERGLSMSNNNPALNTSFLFNLGAQIRIGFWGSNISNVTNNDDNFWFKILTDAKININQTSYIQFYAQDEHYYKSDLRNGQNIGTKIGFLSYLVELEWMNNFQGTKSDAEYFSVNRYFDITSNFKLAAKVGYTNQHSDTYSNYLDFKGFAIYQLNVNSQFEAGVSAVVDSQQFNHRADPALYVSLNLSY